MTSVLCNSSCTDMASPHTCSAILNPPTARAASSRLRHRPAQLLSSKQSVSFCGCSSWQSATQHRAGNAAQRRRCVRVYADSDFYDVLGVGRDVDKAELKKAYRQKARKFHPDVNKEPGAEDMFKKISAAYEVLNDDQKRGIYDRYGEAGLKGMGGGGAGPGMDFNNPFDLFEQLFSGGMGGGGFGGGMGARRAQMPVDGDDERYELQIDFNEAVFGSMSKEITITRLESCGTCNGSGQKEGTTPTTCSTCGGQGQVAQVMQSILGRIQQVTTCPDCNGTGSKGEPCSSCGGDGRVRRSKKISLRVPPGVDNGSRLRVKGEGNAGLRGGQGGDLYVFISVKKHSSLRREGVTIHSDVDVTYIDAILGTSVKVNTLDGEVDLKIPSGTQPGTTLVMGRRGVPRLGNSNIRGDHHVHLRVTIPQKLSAEEKSKVEELRELQPKKDGKKKFGPFKF